MATTLEKLRILVETDTKAAEKGTSRYRKSFEKDAKGVTSALQKLERSMVSSISRQTRAMARMDVLGSYFSTRQIFSFGQSIVTVSGEFDTAMTRMASVTSGATAQFSAMRSQALELGSSTVFSASNAAEAMGFLGMAGFDASQAMGALPGVLDLAQAGMMDLGRSADIASNIMSGFGLQATDMGRINDVLVNTFTSSNTTLEMLGQTMKFLAPQATAAGISLEDSATAAGLLGNAGLQAGIAGRNLSQMISAILKPSDEASVLMRDLGLSFTTAAGGMIPFRDVLQQVEEKGLTAGDRLRIFGEMGGRAVNAMMAQAVNGKSVVDVYDDMAAKISKTGTAQELVTKQADSWWAKTMGLKSAWEGLLIALGDEGFLALAKDVIDWTTRNIQEFEDWIRTSDGFKKVLGEIRGFVMDRFLPGLEETFKKVGKIWEAPGITLGTKIKASLYEIGAEAGKGFKAAVLEGMSGLALDMIAELPVIGNILARYQGGAGMISASAGGAFDTALNIQQGVGSSIMDLPSFLGGLLSGGFDAALDVQRGVGSQIIDLLRDLGLPGFAQGGLVSGPKGGFLAMLHGTEWVIPDNAGQNPYLELARLRGDKLPGFATGTPPISSPRFPGGMGNLGSLFSGLGQGLMEMLGQLESGFFNASVAEAGPQAMLNMLRLELQRSDGALGGFEALTGDKGVTLGPEEVDAFKDLILGVEKTSNLVRANFGGRSGGQLGMLGGTRGLPYTEDMSDDLVEKLIGDLPKDVQGFAERLVEGSEGISKAQSDMLQDAAGFGDFFDALTGNQLANFQDGLDNAAFGLQETAERAVEFSTGLQEVPEKLLSIPEQIAASMPDMSQMLESADRLKAFEQQAMAGAGSAISSFRNLPGQTNTGISVDIADTFNLLAGIGSGSKGTGQGIFRDAGPRGQAQSIVDAINRAGRGEFFDIKQVDLGGLFGNVLSDNTIRAVVDSEISKRSKTGSGMDYWNKNQTFIEETLKELGRLALGSKGLIDAQRGLTSETQAGGDQMDLLRERLGLSSLAQLKAERSASALSMAAERGAHVTREYSVAGYAAAPGLSALGSASFAGVGSANEFSTAAGRGAAQFNLLGMSAGGLSDAYWVNKSQSDSLSMLQGELAESMQGYSDTLNMASAVAGQGITSMEAFNESSGTGAAAFNLLGMAGTALSDAYWVNQSQAGQSADAQGQLTEGITGYSNALYLAEGAARAAAQAASGALAGPGVQAPDVGAGSIEIPTLDIAGSLDLRIHNELNIDGRRFLNQSRRLQAERDGRGGFGK